MHDTDLMLDTATSFSRAQVNLTSVKNPKSARFMLGGHSSSQAELTEDVNYRSETSQVKACSEGAPLPVEALGAKAAPPAVVKAPLLERLSDNDFPRDQKRDPILIADDCHFNIDRPLSTVAGEEPKELMVTIAYAKRSIEDRRRKAHKEGKISRPLNSYMLYRKAYQHTARKVIQKDQQQNASQTVGVSWRELESTDVKSFFMELAKIEQEMHHRAFPTYKYTPTQGRVAKTPSKSRKPHSALSHGLRKREPDSKVGDDLRIIPDIEPTCLTTRREYTNEWPCGQEGFYLYNEASQKDIVSCSVLDPDLSSCLPGSVERQYGTDTSRSHYQSPSGLTDVLDLEHCIDPSLFSRAGDASVQAPSWEWQAPGISPGAELHCLMSDVEAHLSPSLAYHKYAMWAAISTEDHSAAVPWQRGCENNS